MSTPLRGWGGGVERRVVIVCLALSATFLFLVRALFPLLLVFNSVWRLNPNNVVLGKQKRTNKNIKEDDMWNKQSIFWELTYWKDLDVRHSIDVMHVEKNVCESLLGTLLNTYGKTRDHGHARADLKNGN
jgi:hypothetical protein